jgi:hypothetical protein
MLGKIAVAMIIVFASVAVAVAGGPNMEEGLWEVTSKMEMPGMSMPPVTNKQCLTNDNMVPKNANPDDECQITDSQVSGDTVTWTMECSGPNGQMTGDGEITYQGTSFKGKMKMTMPQQGMEMVSHMSGKRVGECD